MRETVLVMKMHSSANRRPFLILQAEVWAETCRPLYEAAGDVDAIFRRALKADGHPLEIVRICRDEPLPAPQDVGAAIVSGSSAMVADRKGWIARTAQWLRHAHAQSLPMLGVCFGHQLIAHALGGKVGQTATSVEYGTVTIDPVSYDPDDPLLGHLAERFPAQAAHFQVVQAPPPGAKVLASNAAGVQALRFGPTTWGVQFHPELSETHIRFILDNREKLGLHGVNVDAGRSSLRPSDRVATVIERFRDYSLQQAGTSLASHKKGV
jgi:GMP synthase (glutamine-hydrolysing)